MQALTLGNGRVAVTRDHEPPRPMDGEVVIRPLRMGVCSTDLELCKGYMGFEGVLGHEFVGIVEDAVDEDQPNPVDLPEDRRLAGIEQRRLGRVGLHQRVGAGVFPVLVAAIGQAHLPDAGERVGPGRGEATGGIGRAEGVEPGRGGVLAGLHELGAGNDHQAAPTFRSP